MECDGSKEINQIYHFIGAVALLYLYEEIFNTTFWNIPIYVRIRFIPYKFQLYDRLGYGHRIAGLKDINQCRIPRTGSLFTRYMGSFETGRCTTLGRASAPTNGASEPAEQPSMMKALQKSVEEFKYTDDIILFIGH